VHSYHAALYASDHHPYRTATSGGVPFGSGLNTLSSFYFMDFIRTTWNYCSLNNGDCLTPKGFSALRVRLSPNQWVDVYNLHTDAGALAADKFARATNIAQVLLFMSTYSAGMPVIIMGDTNMRYTTTDDSIRLLTDAGFTDAWVQLWRGGVPPEKTGIPLKCPFPFTRRLSQTEMMKCEVVDKILYRSAGSALGSFHAYDLTNEHLEFLYPTTGAPLSDHYPLASTINWDEAGSNLRLSDIVGGTGGNFFNDVPALLAAGSTTPRLKTLTLSGASRLVRIVASYDTIDTRTVGRGCETATSITLAIGEGITKVEACAGQKDGKARVFYMKVTTNTGRTLAAGTMTWECYTLDAPSGFTAVGFWGKSGAEINRIGVVWGK